MTEEAAVVTMPLNDKPAEEMESAQVTSMRQEKKKPITKRLLADVLLWCVLFVFAALSAANAAVLQQYSAISLRYEMPFSGQAAYQARQYAIEHNEENTFWPTYWIEDEAQYSAGFKNVSAGCLLFSGNAALVWPAEYLSGAMPGVADDIGCAISSALAWELWGDTDVVGKTLEVDGVSRIVRCVFEEAEPFALLSVRAENLTQAFAAVELSGGPSSPNRGSVESFAAASGLGMPDNILMGTPAFLAELMAMLPLLILVFYGLAMCIRWMRKRSAIIQRVFAFSLFLGVAILLPGFLDMLPDWIIPTKWSDFSFWDSLFGQTGGNLREYLKLSPSLRDVGYATSFFRQIAIAFAASGFALSICFRYHTRAKLETLERRINCG